MRADDRVEARVPVPRHLDDPPALVGVRRRHDEQPRRLRMRVLEDPRARRVAVDRRSPPAPQRLDGLAVLLHDDERDPGACQRRADRPAHASVPDDDRVTAQLAHLVHRSRLRFLHALALQRLEQARPLREPAGDRLDAVEHEGIQRDREERAREDEALPLRRQQAERIAEPAPG